MNEQIWNGRWCIGEKQEEKEREENRRRRRRGSSNCPTVHEGRSTQLGKCISGKNIFLGSCRRIWLCQPFITSRQSHGSIFCRIFEKVHLRGSYLKEDKGQWPKDHHLKAKTAHSLSHLHLMHQSQLLCRCMVQRYCPSSVTHISNPMDHPAQYTGNQSIGNRYLVNEWLW